MSDKPAEKGWASALVILSPRERSGTAAGSRPCRSMAARAPSGSGSPPPREDRGRCADGGKIVITGTDGSITAVKVVVTTPSGPVDLLQG